MEKMIVVNGGYTFDIIMDCFEDSLVHEVDYCTFIELAKDLKIPEEDIQEIQDCMICGSITYLQAYGRVLRKWRDLQGDEATLTTLLSSLKKCDYGLAVETIHEAFNLPMEDIHQKIEEYERTSEPAERNKLIRSYIRQHMMRIIELTTLNKDLEFTLWENNVISDEAYQDLKSTEFEHIKGVRLYDHIVKTDATWEKCRQLIEQLLNLKQHKAVTILAKAFEEKPTIARV